MFRKLLIRRSRKSISDKLPGWPRFPVFRPRFPPFLAYVERNPVRAGIVERARGYPWSSAAVHITGQDESGLLDMEWWRNEGRPNWELRLDEAPPPSDRALRACTYAGRPFGDQTFLHKMAEQFNRHWTPGRPKKKPPVRLSAVPTDQFSLF